jgi:hypothetical protein
VGYSGYMGIPLSKYKDYALAIPKLVAHKVILVGANKAMHKQDEDQVILKGGDNFLKAHIKGGFNYVTEVENDINPSGFRKIWNYISNNPLISAVIAGLLSGVLGGVMGSVLLDYIQTR